MGAVKYLTPRIIEAFFIVALQQYFASHATYPWSRDQQKTAIAVQSAYAEDTREQNLLPGIFVETGSVSIGNETVGNLAHFNVYHDYLIEQLVNLTINGSIAIHCVAESKIETAELAFEVAMFLQGVRTTLADMVQLQFLSTPSISASGIHSREGSVTTFDTVVSLNYAFTAQRKVTPIDRGVLLTEINTYINSPADIAAAGGGIGGTNTGGQTGNWGGVGSGNYPEERTEDLGDYKDDNTETIKLTVKLNP